MPRLPAVLLSALTLPVSKAPAHRHSAWSVCLIVLCLAFCGCQEEASVPDLGEDLLGLTEPEEETSASTDLSLKLKPGSRFPLHKTVQQELVQSALNGKVRKSTSQLELVMAITVDEVRGDEKKFSVQYTRVKYSQNFEGNSVSFDSLAPVEPVPVQALPYQGMISNGFSFWVGSDNQIKEVLGFEAFLEKCLSKVPVEQREIMFKQIAATSQHDGLANFVDDTIGLLPYEEGAAQKSSVVRVGQTWKRRRYMNQPLPLTIENTYTVKEIGKATAQLDVLGSVLPTTSLSPETYDGLNVQIRGGRSYGQCEIDLATGLPTNSQVDQDIEMVVSFDGGVTFEQRKHILTTVKTFPQQGEGEALKLSDSRR